MIHFVFLLVQQSSASQINRSERSDPISLSIGRQQNCGLGTDVLGGSEGEFHKPAPLYFPGVQNPIHWAMRSHLSVCYVHPWLSHARRVQWDKS